MPSLLTLILLALSAPTSRAEYGGYQLTLQIRTKEGADLIGYAYLSEYDVDLDLLSSTEHLMQVLDVAQVEGGESDSIAVFHHRLRYTYRMVGDSAGELRAIHHLSGRVMLPKSAIESMWASDHFEESRLEGISSPLSLADSTWMNVPPVRSVAFGAYLCWHQVFVHVESPTTRDVLARLARLQARIDTTEINPENGDALDGEVWELLKELDFQKVVVVSECTC